MKPVVFLLFFGMLFFTVMPSVYAETDAELGTEFSLELNETANLDGFKITFLNVTDDSRCPSDVTCIWQGMATIQLLALQSLGGMTAEKEFTLDTEKSQFEIFDHMVELVQLDPYPISSKPTGNYVVTLLVSQNAIKEQLPSPLKQIKDGKALTEVQCNEGKVPAYKYNRLRVACVTLDTESQLVIRGWALLRLAMPGDDIAHALCNNYDGKWLEEHRECEYISAEQCSLLGGKYHECESACRHMPDAEVCTLQCVPVCSVK